MVGMNAGDSVGGRRSDPSTRTKLPVPRLSANKSRTWHNRMSWPKPGSSSNTTTYTNDVRLFIIISFESHFIRMDKLNTPELSAKLYPKSTH